MKVVYFSFSGNVRRSIKHSGVRSVLEINEDNCKDSIEEPYILATGTVGFSEVPKEVQSFLEVDHAYIRVITASGNRNWGQNFAKADRTISETYHVSLLMRFEIQGTNKDVIGFRDKVGHFNEDYGRRKVQSY